MAGESNRFPSAPRPHSNAASAPSLGQVGKIRAKYELWGTQNNGPALRRGYVPRWRSERLTQFPTTILYAS